MSDNKKKILVIEDEMDMRFFLSTVLKKSGYLPVLARNGKEGVKAAKEHAPDMILMDVMMPEQGGLLTYTQVRAEEVFNETPVVIVSAVAKDTFLYSLKMLNAQKDTPIPTPDAYVEKPPDPRYLLKVIGDLMPSGEDR